MMFDDSEDNPPVVVKSRVSLEVAGDMQSEISQDVITDNISGYPWNVNFYNQVLKRNDPPLKFDIKESLTMQNYRFIEDLEIRLTTPLDSSDIDKLEGAGYVNIGSAVFIHDLFTAKIKNNRVGIFTLTSAVDKNYEDGKVTYIEFKLLGFADTEKEIYDNLQEKVTNNYVYEKDYKNSNGSPIIVKEDYLNSERIFNNISIHLTNYISKFYSGTTRSLILKTTQGTIVDPYIINFIFKYFKGVKPELLYNVSPPDSSSHLDNNMTLFNAISDTMSIGYCKKLRFIKTDYNMYYTNYFGVDYIVDTEDSLDGRVVKLDIGDYFINDTFYDEDTEDTFEILLHKLIKDETLRVEEVEKELTETLSKSDSDIYFKVPLLLAMYMYIAVNIKT